MVEPRATTAFARRPATTVSAAAIDAACRDDGAIPRRAPLPGAGRHALATLSLDRPPPFYSGTSDCFYARTARRQSFAARLLERT
jgi:hypothetical protein